jgi:GrpB-like predicted nucleotidyltransferase (UPF0157 family)
LSDPVIVVPYDPQWIKLFHETAHQLRTILGDRAVRIDHIGSTSIPGLDAKPIIDIQISVPSLDHPHELIDPLEKEGFRFRQHNPDRSKCFFREPLGNRRTHIHVRQEGSWSQQLTLLFRDYLRNHPKDCKAYAELKYQLAKLYMYDRPKYTESKAPFIWTILQKADLWSREIGWKPKDTDA